MASNKGYKRSWKNLLLNKRYQLRFTLFMVGVSAVLMAGLGWWVMKEANEATTLAMNSVQGKPCPKIPTLTDVPSDDDAVPMKLDDGAALGKDANPPANPDPVPPQKVDAKDLAKIDPKDLTAVFTAFCTGKLACKPVFGEPLVVKGHRCDDLVKTKLGDPAAVEALKKVSISVVHCDGGQTYPVAEPEHHVAVQIDESSMTFTPAIPPDYADKVVSHWTCMLGVVADMDALEARRLLILTVMICCGLLMVFGLAMYGIKMTHRVAGPLFKVQLYLAKMKDGRFDKVYSLRKGDQLVDFYEHFKAAHAGIVQLEKDDISRIKSVIAAAEAAGVGDHESVGELRALLQRKEKSIE